MGSFSVRGGNMDDSTVGALDGGAGDGQMSDLQTNLGCDKHEDCNGGFCVDGACCPSAAQVCGAACCNANETCFANACVVPRGLCHSTGDCEPDQYCEPALGPKGTGGDPSPGCLQPAPLVGRCLDLPPRCPDGSDGTPPSTGDDCLPLCEYHSQPGKLRATVQWSWGSAVTEHADKIDVWSTPLVGRLYDTNCDGKINELDPPAVVFVSGDVNGGCACSEEKAKTGVLRMVDGASGKTIWSLARAHPNSRGFAGFTMALGDIDRDGVMDIVAVTGEGHVVVVDGTGTVLAISDTPLPYSVHKSFGWGGALALGDMDVDGYTEVAYGATVYTTVDGLITHRFTGTGGIGGAKNRAISAFVDLNGSSDGHLELIAGNTAYRSDGSILWRREDLKDGYPAVGDFNNDGLPEVVHIAKGQVTLLEGASGKTALGPLVLPDLTDKDNGGPPTVADFDGDGQPEIGVALRMFYYVIEADYARGDLSVLWRSENHDLSSSVTGSTVFDFEGDGSAEVVYNDECFLWVYDGQTGSVRFATPTSSFTATEASMVADVDGDGHAEMLMVSNSASPTNWKCDVEPWNQPDTTTDRPAWTPPPGGTVYRGLTLWRDLANSWVGTRTLWNQHTYHVTNICDHRDSGCNLPNNYGSIPTEETRNWEIGWLNNFRQNVQDRGIFDAPDATVDMKVECIDPPVLVAYLRNRGAAILPVGVRVGFYLLGGASGDHLLHTAVTTSPLFPGQVVELRFAVPAGIGRAEDHYQARVLVDPNNPTFKECRDQNNDSTPVTASCLVE